MKYQINILCVSEEERKELNKLLTLLKLKTDKPRSTSLIELIEKEIK